MNIKTVFDFGDKVYLITDREQFPRMVTSFSVFPPGVVAYRLSCGENETSHYEMEISSAKNYSP